MRARHGSNERRASAVHRVIAHYAARASAPARTEAGNPRTHPAVPSCSWKSATAWKEFSDALP
jgi:hypothetical protein